jgi:hypothetical protein
MQLETIVEWAWPRGNRMLQAINWRDRLYQAMCTFKDTAPTSDDLQYQIKENAESDGYVASLAVHIDGIPYTFTSASQDTQREAIRCVSWIALMHLHTMGIINRPMH